MLAFLMTAVSMFMSSGIMSYKGAKADIRVHNSAQEVYDKISDAVMEAKDIYLFGYIPGDNKLYCFMRNNHDKSDEASQLNADKAKVIVVKDMIGTSFFNGITDIEVKYFENLSSSDIQIRALVIDTSTPINKIDFDDSNSVKAGDGAGEYRNQLTNESVAISVQTRENGEGNIVDIEDRDNNPVYTVNDTIRQMFVFDEENMYYMTKYAFATANDDNLTDAGTSGKKEDYLYSSSFDTTDDGKTSVYATFDVDNSAVSINLDFSDRNMTYKTNGMIKIRNSFVLRAKK